jgi:ABC-type arginine transport system ATPase subunit
MIGERAHFPLAYPFRGPRGADGSTLLRKLSLTLTMPGAGDFRMAGSNRVSKG